MSLHLNEPNVRMANHIYKQYLAKICYPKKELALINTKIDNTIRSVKFDRITEANMYAVDLDLYKINYIDEIVGDSKCKIMEITINNTNIFGEVVILECDFEGSYFEKLYDEDKLRHNELEKANNASLKSHFETFLLELIKNLYLAAAPANKALTDGKADLGSTK